MRKHALFHGRFQPPSIAHFETLGTILQKWELVTIGVVYAIPKPAWLDPKWNSYVEEVLQTYTPARNPFSAHERVRMWNECIRHSNLTERVQCVAAPIPYFDESFSEEFPPEEYDFVKPEAEKHETLDLLREQTTAQILNRSLFTVRPQWKLHVTEMRNLVSQGAQWHKFLAPGIGDVFSELNGNERMRDPI